MVLVEEGSLGALTLSSAGLGGNLYKYKLSAASSSRKGGQLVVMAALPSNGIDRLKQDPVRAP